MSLALREERVRRHYRRDPGMYATVGLNFVSFSGAGAREIERHMTCAIYQDKDGFIIDLEGSTNAIKLRKWHVEINTRRVARALPRGKYVGTRVQNLVFFRPLEVYE